MSANGAEAPGPWRRAPQDAPRRDHRPQQQRPPPAPPTAPRRASPPRPSLLLGGVPQCELELSKLQQAYKELLKKDEEEVLSSSTSSSSSPLPSPEWSRLVSRHRWLRETLVSCGAGLATPLGRAAAAAGADAALRARDWGEFLKSVSYLTGEGEEEATPSSTPPSSTSSSLSTSPSLYAPHEADALLLLYFSCVPPEPQSLDVATRLRGLAMMRQRQRRQRGNKSEEEERRERRGGDVDEKPPPPLSPSHPLPAPIDLAVSVHVAMATGDGLSLARLSRSHPAAASSWRARALMKPALERGLWSSSSTSSSSSSPPPAPPPSPPLPVRGGYPAALAALSASYRSLTAAVARRLMGIEEEEGKGGDKLLRELVVAARSRGDRWALGQELLPQAAAAGELKLGDKTL